MPVIFSYNMMISVIGLLLSGVPDYFDRNKISSGGDLSHYSSVWFVFINHIFQFCNELCTYCNILDIYLS